MLSCSTECSVFCLFSAPASSPGSGVRDRFIGVECSGAYAGVGVGTSGGGIGAGTAGAEGATAGVVVTGLEAATDIGITGGFCRAGAAASKGDWSFGAGGGFDGRFEGRLDGGFNGGFDGGFDGGFGDRVGDCFDGGSGEGLLTVVGTSTTLEALSIGLSIFFSGAETGS